MPSHTEVFCSEDESEVEDRYEEMQGEHETAGMANHEDVYCAVGETHE